MYPFPAGAVLMLRLLMRLTYCDLSRATSSSSYHPTYSNFTEVRNSLYAANRPVAHRSSLLLGTTRSCFNRKRLTDMYLSPVEVYKSEHMHVHIWSSSSLIRRSNQSRLD